MAAVWLRFRADVRTRWRAWIGVAVLAGVFGGAVVAAAAGASRADSVVDRNLVATRPPDVYIAPEFTVAADDPGLLATLTFENLRTLPSVEDAVRFRGLAADEELNILVSDDPRVGRSLIRQILIAGRAPDPGRPGEASINFLAAERLGLAAGDTYTVHFKRDPHDPDVDEANAGPGPVVALEITGVIADIGDLGAFAEPGMFLTPAFLRRYGAEIPSNDLFTLFLDDGPGSYGSFERELTELSGGKAFFYVKSQSLADQARRSFGLQAVSLWILAGFLALATVLVLGQTIARQTFLESGDHPVLRALGWSRGQLFAIGILRSGGIAVGAAAVAVAVATAVSPLAPFGLAGLLDPHDGFSVPAVPMLTGSAAVLIGVLSLALHPCWKAASLGTRAPSTPEAAAPSLIARLATRVAAGPAASIGTRMALEPGRGRTAVPVRTTIGAASVAVVGLVAALVVGSSLGHMKRTPRVYGWNWDLLVNGPFDEAARRDSLLGVAGVRQASFGSTGGGLLVNDVHVDGLIVRIGDRIHPPILEGRAPAVLNEAALGRKTMRAAGVRVGDDIRAGPQGSAERLTLRVVGVTVLPFESDVSALGEGIFTRVETLRQLFADVMLDTAFVRVDPMRRASAAVQIRELFGPESVSLADPPLTVVDFGRVSNMPYLLAGTVALLAAGTLAHGLVTSVRRRRRDLAVLKALGFDRGQLRRAVAWQASATAVVTLVVGIPFGVIAGRWVWTLFADETGFSAVPVSNVAALAAMVPGTLLLATLIAVFPGRSAARLRPALVLRAE